MTAWWDDYRREAPRPLDWRAFMRSFPCRYCGASPGQRCRSKNGDRVSQTHSARFYDAKAEQDKGKP